MAESIRVGNPRALGLRALRAVRASNGAGVALTDEEILEAQGLLSRMAGIFAEPSRRHLPGRGRTAAPAGGHPLRRHGGVQRDRPRALKQVASVAVPRERLQPIEPDLDALRETLAQESSTRPAEEK